VLVIAGIWLIEDGHTAVAVRTDAHPAPVAEESAHGLARITSRGELNRLRSRVRAAHGRAGASFLWVDVVDPTAGEMAMLADVLHLPPLHVEDALVPHQRPKLERSDRVFLVIKAVTYIEATSDIETHQVAAFISGEYLVTVSHGRYDVADAMHNRLAREPALRRMGTAGAFYALLDTLVDQYLEVAEEIAVDIEEIEESVFSPSRSDDSAAIYRLKRENLELRRAVAPLAGAAGLIVRGMIPQLSEPLKPYYADVADHLLRAAEITDSHDQLLMTMLMAATARRDLQQNADVRRISAWVAIVAVPTLIAGIYGMNFEFMPELDEWWGYPWALGLMAAIAFSLHRAFKRAGWL